MQPQELYDQLVELSPNGHCTRTHAHLGELLGWSAKTVGRWMPGLVAAQAIYPGRHGNRALTYFARGPLTADAWESGQRSLSEPVSDQASEATPPVSKHAASGQSAEPAPPRSSSSSAVQPPPSDHDSLSGQPAGGQTVWWFDYLVSLEIEPTNENLDALATVDSEMRQWVVGQLAKWGGMPPTYVNDVVESSHKLATGLQLHRPVSPVTPPEGITLEGTTFSPEQGDGHPAAPPPPSTTTADTPAAPVEPPGVAELVARASRRARSSWRRWARRALRRLDEMIEDRP